MTVSLNNYNSVTIVTTSSATQAPSINNLALFTIDTPSNSENYGVYTDSSSVATNYGSNSSTALIAQAIFSQIPNVTSAKGKLIIFPISTGESLHDAIVRVKAANYIYFYGIITNKTLTDQNITDVATYIQDKDHLFFAPISDKTKNDPSTGFIKSLVTAGFNKTHACIYTDSSKTYRFIGGLASRFFTTDFSRENSAINIHGKTITGFIGDSSIVDQDITNCQTTGAILYPDVSGFSAKVYEGGANGFIDNIYNYTILKNEIQYAIANVQFLSNTKLPQTDATMDRLSGVVMGVLNQAIITGIIAPGTWNGSNTFGDPETFKSNISKYGFYIYYQSTSLQSQADRDARLSPVLMVAAKMSGAINFIEVFGIVEN